MSASAHLTILWGGTPIGVDHVPPGGSVGIGEDGVITRASRCPTGALVVQMHARGATVSRPPGATRKAADQRSIPTGADVEIAIAAPGGAPVYRRGVAWEPAPVILRIAVTAEDPRPFRRPAIAARVWGIMASVAAAHAVALAIASYAMPPRKAFDATSAAGSEADAPSFRVDAIPAEAYRDAQGEDRSGDAPAVCSTLAEPLVGRSLAVQGPIDNPDPHIARHHARSDELTLDVIGPLRRRDGSDEAAPTAPWGRDDALGVDAFSATGTAHGELRYPLATCFGAPPTAWSCSADDDPPAPPTPERLGLIGIGEASAPPPGRGDRRRPARVAVDPIAVAANVPRWLVASAVREVMDPSRACYERALADDATLTGRLDAILKVRGGTVSVELDPKGDLARSPALRCCVEHAHEALGTELPKGTRATARYSITFGRPAAPAG